MEFTPSAMNKLVELLREPEPDVLQGDDIPYSGYEVISNRDQLPRDNFEQNNLPKTIEEFEEREAAEIENIASLASSAGDKKTPEYSMNYQQSVTAEDVYLQIGPKTPSSASCENLIVKIRMPGDKMENVELAVDTKSVTVNSSKYFLKLPLPHEINPDDSKANWDGNEKSLILTLKLNREFDFVNF